MTKKNKYEEKFRIFRLNKKLTPYKSAIRIALIYLIYGALWIILSDQALALLVKDPQLYIKLSTVKGWLYVALTTGFIYVLVVSTLDLYVEAKQKVESINEDLQQQLEKTTQSEQRFQLAVKGSFDSIWEYDPTLDSIVMSDALLLNLGYTGDERHIANLETWYELIHPADLELFRQRIENFIAIPYENFEFTYRVLRKNGNVAWIRTHGSARIDENGKIIRVAGSHSDVTIAHEFQDELTRLAYYNTLTGLLNWHGFSNKVDQRIKSQPEQSFSILYLDIDDFKNINDVHGYSVGDQLLRDISAELTALNQTPDFIANLGGDGFGFLLETIQYSELLYRINHIYETFRKIRNVEGQSITVYASIGIAQYPKDASTFKDLMKCADEAMYEAKNKGKNTFVFFSEEIHIDRINQIALIQNLRNAVEKNELYMMYQPVYRLRDHRLSSIESLVRWNPEGKGNIPPDIFIPLAESTGLIGKIELWVFENVFKQVIEWRSTSRKNTPIAINLSSYGIVDDLFILRVVELLKFYGIKEGEVEVEITETGLIEGYEAAIRNLLVLRLNGIKILLDDFGKGYSSFTHLVELPIDVLKIDIGFINRIHSSKEIDSIIMTIVNLAHSIHLEVVAEGIEHEYQFEFLRSIDTDFGQGYLLHRPTMPEIIQSLFDNLTDQ